MTPADLAALVEMEKKATPGPPWRLVPGERDCGAAMAHPDGDCDECYWMTPPSIEGPFTEDCGEYYGLSEANAALIAALRNAAPALLAVVMAAVAVGDVNEREAWSEWDDALKGLFAAVRALVGDDVGR